MLTKNELVEVKGGATKAFAGIALGVGAIISFIIGVVDGYLRPVKCNAK